MSTAIHPMSTRIIQTHHQTTLPATRQQPHRQSHQPRL